MSYLVTTLDEKMAVKVTFSYDNYGEPRSNYRLTEKLDKAKHCKNEEEAIQLMDNYMANERPKSVKVTRID